MVHVTPNSREQLLHLRDNLRFLEALDEDRIPRVAAWRDSGPRGLGQEWAMMVCREIPGAELAPRTFSPGLWADLSRLLLRVHSLSADAEGIPAGPRIDHAAAFADFAECLLLRLEDLPLKPRRVREHLAAMADYVSAHAERFAVTSRAIHGELNRANLLADGDRAGIIDWMEMAGGDYLYDLATLKFAMDSVAPRLSAELLREQAHTYRARFADETLELRMRFFLALPGLVHAFEYAGQTALFPAARAWRVRTCYLHSEAQWRSPLRLDLASAGAPAVRTAHWPDEMPAQVRGLYYLVAPKRVG
jgi:aminoglycoside phosphotransferase (APT) family kinase protein